MTNNLCPICNAPLTHYLNRNEYGPIEEHETCERGHYAYDFYTGHIEIMVGGELISWYSNDSSEVVKDCIGRLHTAIETFKTNEKGVQLMNALNGVTTLPRLSVNPIVIESPMTRLAAASALAVAEYRSSGTSAKSLRDDAPVAPSH